MQAVHREDQAEPPPEDASWDSEGWMRSAHLCLMGISLENLRDLRPRELLPLLSNRYQHPVPPVNFLLLEARRRYVLRLTTRLVNLWRTHNGMPEYTSAGESDP